MNDDTHILNPIPADHRYAWDASTVAGYLSVTEAAIKNLHRDKKLTGVRIGRSLRWLPSHVQQYIDLLAAGAEGGDDE